MATPKFEDTDPLFDETEPMDGVDKESGLNKTARYIRKVGGMLGKPLEPIGEALALPGQASEWASNKLAEAGHPVLGMAAAAPAIMSEAVSKPFEWANLAGEALAEKTAEKGLNPYASAALGTAVSMAPDIAMGVGGLSKRAVLGSLAKETGEAAMRPLARAGTAVKELATGPSVEEATALAQREAGKFVPSAAEKAGVVGESMVSSADDALMQLKQTFADLKTKVLPKVGPAEEKAVALGKESVTKAAEPVETLRGKLKEVADQGKQKADMLEQMKQKAKKGLEDVENAQGMRFKSSPKFEKLVGNKQRMAQLAQRLEKLTPDVAEKLPTGKLQVYRKLAQEAKDNISAIGNAQMQKGREVAAQTLSKRIPEFQEARSVYHDVTNAQAALEEEVAKKQSAVKMGLKDATDVLKTKEAEAKEMLTAVRNTERQALSTEQKSELAAAQKKIMKAHQEARQARVEASQLQKAAKAADDAELSRITTQGDQLVTKAMKRAKLLKALKVGGLAALGLKGASYILP
jgi:hypothetical protein